jgi:Flp pilus assembly protein TadG
MKILRDASGSVMVELAVCISVFVLIFVGIVNYAFLIEVGIQVQEAAAAGAEYGTIPGNYNDFPGMVAAARASVSSQVLSTMATPVAVNVYSCSPGGTVVARTASCYDGGTPLMFVQVTTSATESVVLHYVGMPSTLTMTGFASYEVPWT